MSVVCDSCGTENPPGTQFCDNPTCQAYLVWTELDAGASPGPRPAPRPPGQDGSRPSGAVKPGALPSNRAHRPPDQDLTTGEPPPPQSVTLTSAPTKPGRVVGQAAKQAAVEPPLPQAARGPLRYEFIRETKAPVTVKPIDETPSNQPDGQSSTNGRHGPWFSIDRHALSVDRAARSA
jgi:hypothetical protein